MNGIIPVFRLDVRESDSSPFVRGVDTFIVPNGSLTDNGDGSVTLTYGSGSGSVTSVNITQPAAGITATGGPITTSGSITLALANDLAGLEGLSSTGLAVRTATDTWTTRTVTGTTDRISVTNGNGVSGNPTLDIAATYVGQSSITTLGTITSGVWNAGNVTTPVLDATTGSIGEINISGNTIGADDMILLLPAGGYTYLEGTATYFIDTSGNAAFNTLSAASAGTNFNLNLTNATLTGYLPLANLTQGLALSVLGVTGNAVADHASITAGSDHQVLRRSGTSVAFGAINLASSNAVTGTLPLGNGGTGLTAVPGSSGQLIYNNSSAFGATAAISYSGTGTQLRITSQSAANVTLALRDAASQTGHLIDFENSAGTVAGFISTNASVGILQMPTFSIRNSNGVSVFASADNVYATIMPVFGTRTDVSGTPTLCIVGGSGSTPNFTWSPNAANTASYTSHATFAVLNTGGSNSGGTYYGYRAIVTETSVTGLTARKLYSGGTGSVSSYTEKFFVNTDGDISVQGNISGISTSSLGYGYVNVRPLSRTVPTVVNDEVRLGTWTVGGGNGSATFYVDLVVSNASFSISKQYVIPAYYNSTAGTYYIVPPISDSGTYGGNDVSLDFSQTNADVTLRIRRTAGSTAGTATVTVRTETSSETFVASTATSSVSAPSSTLALYAWNNASNLTTGTVPNARLDATLGALAVYNTNGLLTQTAADTFTGRTITGTSNRISVTNGDGVSGNPTIDIHTSYVGQSSITTVGTLTSGATGTGFTIALGSSTVTGDLAFANLTQGSALSVLGVSGNATADVASIVAANDHEVLRRSGTTLGFGAINLASSSAVTGTLPLGNGGTGLTAVPGSSGQVIYNNSSAYDAAAGLVYSSSSPNVLITAQNAAHTPLVVRAAATPSANVFSVQNSSSVAKFYIDSNFRIVADGINHYLNPILSAVDDGCLYMQPAVNSSSTNTQGIYFNPTWTAFGTASTFTAFRAFILPSTITGTSSIVNGTNIQLGINGSGTLAEANAHIVNPYVATGTVTNFKGLSVLSATNATGGAIGTFYGIKIENQTLATTNYSIHTGTGLVRFGDRVQIAIPSSGTVGELITMASSQSANPWEIRNNSNTLLTFFDSSARINLPNNGLRLADTNASHYLSIVPGSDISADRTLTLTTGDANRTIDLGGNLTVSDTVTVSSNQRIASINFIIDGGGSVINTGVAGYIRIDFDCTINKVTMLADVVGSVVVDIWKDTYCVDAETECLTKNGWKKHNEISVGDEILSYDINNRTANFEPIKHLYSEYYMGKMLQFDGSCSALTTPNHRWPIWYKQRNGNETIKVVESKDLTLSGKILRNVDYKAKNIIEVENDFIDILAWYFTEGNLRPNNKCVWISQSQEVHPEYCDMIRNSLNKIGKKYYHRSDIVKDKRIGKFGNNLGKGLWWAESPIRENGCINFRLTGDCVKDILTFVQGKDKIPNFELFTQLPKEQLLRFINVCIYGDGTKNVNKAPYFSQTNKERLEAFYNICVLAGLSPSYKEIDTENGVVYYCNMFGGKKIDTQNTEINRYSYVKDLEHNWINYFGKVWCPTVDSGFWVARRNGKIFVTGNSNYPPTNPDSITASANPTITTAIKSEDSTLTGWTTSISAGDILAFNVDSVTSITKLTIDLKVTKT